MNFTGKTSLITAFSAILTALAVGGLGYYTGSKHIKETAARELTNISYLKSREIERWMDGQLQMIQSLAQRPLIKSLTGAIKLTPGDRALQRQLLDDHLLPVVDDLGGYLEMSLIDAETGEVLLSTTAAEQGKFKEDRDYFNGGLTQVYAGEVVYEHTRQALTLHVSAPVRDETGVTAVLAAQVNWSMVREMLQSLKAYQSGSLNVFLTNLQGMYLVAPEHSSGEDFKAVNRSQSVLECSVGGKTASTEYLGVSNLKVLGASSWSERYHFCVTAEKRRDYAYLKVSEMAKQMLLLVILLSAIFGAAGASLGRRVARPVKLLSDTVNRISTGDLSLRTSIRGDDELGLLGVAFDKMMDDLQQITTSRDELNREVEERKKIEKQLRQLTERLNRQTEHLSRSNQDLENFAYVASHDLQEPLRMVANFTSLLQNRYTGQLDEKADTYIHYAVDGAQRMQVLINDLLTYSRLNTRASPPETVDLQALLKQILSDMQLAIEEAAAVIDLDPLPALLAEPSQMRTLFQNLISNAIKFRGDQPPQIQITAAKVDDGWQFSVSDNGIGIDPSLRERIFIIFQRLHTQQQYPGSGLGLAMVKRIVERHAGEIRVEPSASGGSCFTFILKDVQTEVGDV